MGQAHQIMVDETCCEWMTFKMRKSTTHPKLEASGREPHAGACDGQRCAAQKNVRATRCSVFTPRRVHDIRQCLYAISVKEILCGFERVCSHHSFHQL